MTTHVDPWANHDHDPTSWADHLARAAGGDVEPVRHSAVITTVHALGLARADIHDAVAAHDDRHRRRQYALSARDYASMVILAPDSTRQQREYAGYYLADAEVLIANT
jgi:hypothetical protein